MDLQKLGERLLLAIDDMFDGNIDQDEALRFLLLHGVEEMYQYEDFVWNFLRDIAMIAVDNMQDARLDIIEAQIFAMKNEREDFDPGEFLLELALMIAFESTISLALPAVAVQKSTIVILSSVSGRIRHRKRIAKFTQSEALSSLGLKLRSRRDFFDQKLLSLYQKEKLTSVYLEELDVEAAVQNQQAVVLINGSFGNEKLKDFWEVAKARLQEDIAETAKNALTLPTSRNDASVDESNLFQSGAFVSDIVAALAREKEKNFQEYLNLKTMLLAKKEGLAEEEFAQRLYAKILVELPDLRGYYGVLLSQRPAMINSFELALWTFYYSRIRTESEHQISEQVFANSPLSNKGYQELFLDTEYWYTGDYTGENGTRPQVHNPNVNNPGNRLHILSVRRYHGFFQIADEQAFYIYRKFILPKYQNTAQGPARYLPYRESAYFEAEHRSREQDSVRLLIKELKIHIIEFLKTIQTNLEGSGQWLHFFGNNEQEFLKRFPDALTLPRFEFTQTDEEAKRKTELELIKFQGLSRDLRLLQTSYYQTFDKPSESLFSLEEPGSSFALETNLPLEQIRQDIRDLINILTSQYRHFLDSEPELRTWTLINEIETSILKGEFLRPANGQ